MQTITSIYPGWKRNTILTRLTCTLGLVMGAAVTAGAQDTRLLQDPAVSADHLAFVYAGDLWVSGRDGANPRRLTSHAADEGHPHFSPDGDMIAFTANYGGNDDVYVIPTAGGQPKRLTWHPGDDVVTDWTRDGSSVVFTSAREMKNGRSSQLYTVPVDGGFPDKVMDAVMAEAAYSPNGRQIAYRPYRQANSGASGWRLHRGGSTPPIWIIGADGEDWVKIPRGDNSEGRSNDTNPLWMGNTVYFLSDRDDTAVNLYAYETRGGGVRQVTTEVDWDIRAADGHGDHIVYSVGGQLKELTLTDGSVRDISVTIRPDLPQTRPQWKDASRTVERARLSPTAKRAVLTARGDIFTVPVKDGSTRNLTATTGTREMDALWSPKGDRIAYISDAGSRHSLVIQAQTGGGAVKTVPLADTGYFSLHGWTADGRRIILGDSNLRLWALDLDNDGLSLIETAERRDLWETSLSPDGQWLAYTSVRANFFSDLILYNLATGTSTRVTDGMADIGSVAFSPDGKYLYFSASTNAGQQSVGLDMSTQERPLRYGLYVAVLAADGTSPMLPKTGDEDGDETGDEAGDKDDDNGDENGESDNGLTPTRIDLDGLASRISALPVAERNVDSLGVASDGALFYLHHVQPGSSVTPPEAEYRATATLHRYDFEEREDTGVLKGVANVTYSADGKQFLAEVAGRKHTVGKMAKKPDGKPLKTGDMRMRVDPRAEWAQIFDDTWRMERDYFYDPGLHGLDWSAIRAKYEPLVAHVGRREDLTKLIVEMIAEMQVGHNRAWGGDVHRETRVPVGLLGADLRVENGAYRIATLYTGERWNPFLKAPLAEPGLGVGVGTYILGVNGQAVSGRDNIFALFEGTVGKQVRLDVADNARGRNRRTVTVEPIANDRWLRRWNWIEENRAYVAEKTDGRVGYVYLPNTAGAGYTFFNRMFFPQTDKSAMIVDERMNGGGQAANYITDVLSRTYLSGWKDRAGLVFDTPGGAIYGPKVMLIDQDAGSGGDFLPYSFRHMGIGTLIGKRTWGGLIGIFANPLLIDGGYVSVPYFRFFTPDGQWTVENQGVAPDIDVDLDPEGVNKGRDSQLDRAIEEVLRQLEDHSPIRREQAPPYPTALGQ